LLRFVARDGELALRPTDPGRGAYTCRRLACFERALASKAFNRTLKRTVRIDQDLQRLFQEPFRGDRVPRAHHESGSTLTADHG
jgi:predicted RNA-binding protein YlxR (DUF448 family)